MDTCTAPALDELADATPAGRNRAIDFYRVVAMVFVAVGHWFVIAIGTDADGELFARNALEVAPTIRPGHLAVPGDAVVLRGRRVRLGDVARRPPPTQRW